MNKISRTTIFLLILSLALGLTTFKVLKIVIAGKEKITGLSKEVAGLNGQVKELTLSLKETEESLAQAKLNIEDLNYKLDEEKNRSASFEKRYLSEKDKAGALEAANLTQKKELEGLIQEREKFSVEVEKLAEEKEFLSRDLKEVRQAKEALEAFVGETREGASPAKLPATITNGRIVAVYPLGLLAIEVEKAPADNPGKIIKNQKEIRFSKIYSSIITLEALEAEDLKGLKKDDVVKYVR